MKKIEQRIQQLEEATIPKDEITEIEINMVRPAEKAGDPPKRVRTIRIPVQGGKHA